MPDLDVIDLSANLENRKDPIGQFAQLNETLQALQTTSAAALTPSESITQSMSDQLADVQKKAGEGVDIGDALDTSKSEKATEAVGGLGDALGGLGVHQRR